MYRTGELISNYCSCVSYKWVLLWTDQYVNKMYKQVTSIHIVLSLGCPVIIRVGKYNVYKAEEGRTLVSLVKHM